MKKDPVHNNNKIHKLHKNNIFKQIYSTNKKKIPNITKGHKK